MLIDSSILREFNWPEAFGPRKGSSYREVTLHAYHSVCREDP